MWFSEGHNEGLSLPHQYAVATTTLVLHAFSGIWQLCDGSFTGKFLFQSWGSQQFLWHVLVSLMVFIFCFQVAMFPYGDSTIGVATPPPFRVYPWQAYVYPGDGLWPTWGVHWVAAPQLPQVGGASLSHLTAPKPFSAYGKAYRFGSLAESPHHSAFPTRWRGVFFSR